MVAASSRVVVFRCEHAELQEVEAPPTRDWYLKLFKPKGVICSHRAEKLRPGPIVSALYPEGAHEELHAVGRLDRSSEGLLLLSSDGLFTRFATMPELHVEKEYLAVTDCAKDAQPPSDAVLSRLCSGVELSDGAARALTAEVVAFDGRFARLRLVVTEGRFRMVRRMLRAVGYSCLQLLRTRVGRIGGVVLRPASLAEAAREAWHPSEPTIAPARLGDASALQPGEYAAVAAEDVAEVYERGLLWLQEYSPV